MPGPSIDAVRGGGTLTLGVTGGDESPRVEACRFDRNRVTSSLPGADEAIVEAVSVIGAIFRALDDHGVRYVIVGGLATVLHGHARLTADVDLVVDLSDGEAIKAVAALSSLGMVPRAPVEPRDFADPAARRRWIDEKGMRVFSLWDPRAPLREVDLFVESPIAFEDLWARSVEVTLQNRAVRIASIPDLIEMKRLAGRAKDIEDIAALSAIAGRRRP